MIQRIAALATCYNRRELTLESLQSLLSQQVARAVTLDVYLVDDGSSDGTAEAVGLRFPSVRVLSGDGTLYWNGGMRKAFRAAMDGDYDAYIWFNDDSRLLPGALQKIIECAEEVIVNRPGVIVAGSMRRPGSVELTYGGLIKRAKGLRLDFYSVEPHPHHSLPCDTMNGNFTLISRSVAQTVGNLDARFKHQLGDFDYGLRAKKLGFDIVAMPGFAGECEGNSSANTWRDPRLPLRARWRQLMSPKGAPPKEWVLYTARHFGWRFPLYAISPYVKTLLGLR
ncbi:glycosyltransferase family 2 protein [Terriglobus albidus]|uniref:glycosyltransferase family 2 protein n=1 Tax=Terriglobus albidus TaxID=1592106 RepID=UPI0021E0D715|nr:glycosyltransferase family 2 protein [Terriglobus albidus]